MLYRRFGKTNEMVSALGFGCMRLPLLPGGDMTRIDEVLATELLHQAIEAGVNYVDTAYPYHGTGMDSAGESEPFVGKALADGYREKVMLATKLPSWRITSRADMDRYLDEQLARLKTDHIDFYLVHNLNSYSWPVLKENGISDFLDAVLADGRIRYAGFSFHDNFGLFKEIADYYDWTFCQIQYNYLDEEYQAGLAGLRYAAAKDMGIAIMEPLRGGKLAAGLPQDVRDVFDRAVVSLSPAEWALRWVLNQPEVSMVLSGMNSREQLQENLKTAGTVAPSSLLPYEREILDKAKRIFKDKIKVNCTTCGYCMPCPSGVDIPVCFSLLNNLHMFGQELRYNYWLEPQQRASACIECGECESHCPQGIPIIEELKRVKAIFEEGIE